RIEQSQRRRCAGDVPGDTHRALKVRNEISDVRWKHVLLPMWSVTYQFRGKPYAVLVHGQSGRIVGHAPYSWVKILLAVLAVAVAVAIAAAVSQR
ncbi:MAG: zinc ribbon domain-containing protein, partial [Planctomycetota bacterium]